jgi:hypothetical protein
VTIKTATPLIPDFAIPNRREQPKAIRKPKLRIGTGV